MKQNIVIICCDYAFSRRIANILAEKLDMRFFDIYDYFVFENTPNTFDDIVNKNGEEYIDRKMRNILKMGVDFSGMVCVLDLKIADISKDLFEKIKENSVVFLIKKDIDFETNLRNNFLYKTEKEKQYFNFSKEKIIEIENEIENKLADYTLETKSLTYSQIKEIIYEDLNSFID